MHLCCSRSWFTHAGPLHTYCEPVEFSVEVASGVVANQIVRAEILDDAPHAGGEIAVLHDRDTVGGVGHRPQRVVAGFETPRILDDTHRRVPAADAAGDGHNVLVEHDEAARIDRIERRVAGVRLVEDVEKALFVAQVGEQAFGLGGYVRDGRSQLACERIQTLMAGGQLHSGLPDSW